MEPEIKKLKESTDKEIKEAFDKLNVRRIDALDELGSKAPAGFIFKLRSTMTPPYQINSPLNTLLNEIAKFILDEKAQEPGYKKFLDKKVDTSSKKGVTIQSLIEEERAKAKLALELKIGKAPTKEKLKEKKATELGISKPKEKTKEGAKEAESAVSKTLTKEEVKKIAEELKKEIKPKETTAGEEEEATSEELKADLENLSDSLQALNAELEKSV